MTNLVLSLNSRDSFHGVSLTQTIKIHEGSSTVIRGFNT